MFKTLPPLRSHRRLCAAARARRLDRRCRSSGWSRPRSRRPAEINQSPFSLPATPNFGVFAEAWEQGDFTRLYLNSLGITVVSVTGLLAFCSAAGYALAHFEFRGKEALFLYFLAGMMIPPQVIMVPSFKIMATLGLINTYWRGDPDLFRLGALRHLLLPRLFQRHPQGAGRSRAGRWRFRVEHLPPHHAAAGAAGAWRPSASSISSGSSTISCGR